MRVFSDSVQFKVEKNDFGDKIFFAKMKNTPRVRNTI